MGSLRSKILFTMIVYCSGIVTAVYFLVPSSTAAADQTQAGEMSTGSQQAQILTGHPDINSQVWAISVRTGIDTCISFAEEYALRVADLIRSQMEQDSDQSD
ncbi:MAG: hypothetical protein ABFR90_02750 [Planctomycetota bacterium]